jgi:hypothetical protein
VQAGQFPALEHQGRKVFCQEVLPEITELNGGFIGKIRKHIIYKLLFFFPCHV